MNLPILDPWYADGLRFTCSTCGNCCTGGPGFVFISKDEIVRLADHLKLSPYDVVDRYCRKLDGQFSLTERRNAHGEYDCVFLKEIPAGEQQGGDGQVHQTRRVCGIYEARPLQCRTWPFWPSNLSSQEAWNNAGRRCHGINQGREFTKDQIQSIRDAADWPANPPTSKTEP